MRQIDFKLDRSKTAVQYNRQGVDAMLRTSYREASYYLLSAVVCDPDYWPAFFNLGNCWAKLDDSDAAIWAYEQAVRGSDDYAPLNLPITSIQSARPLLTAGLIRLTRQPQLKNGASKRNIIFRE